MSRTTNECNSTNLNYWILLKGFTAYLYATKKYTELLTTKTAGLSMIIGIFIAVIINLSLDYDKDGRFVQSMQGLIVNLISGFLGLLGFIVGGLALVSGTIETNIINKILKRGKISSLMGLLYSFCFHGGLVLLSIILLTFTFFISTLPYAVIDSFLVNRWALLVLSAMISYFCAFAMLYSMTVLITCLRLFLLRYQSSGGVHLSPRHPHKIHLLRRPNKHF